MPSPFPGMNPYLEHEDAWRDFHQSFMPAAREMLTRQVSPDYIVKVEENLYIHERGASERHLLGAADVALAERTAGVEGATPAVATLVAPARIRLPRVNIVPESYLEIRDRQTRRLVTVIELLSPTNKRAGEDRTAYVSKREHLLRGTAHFVEIALLRGLPRMPYITMTERDYYALVSRVETRPDVDFWPIHLRERLPILPIPLQAPHADAQLDLQAVLHRIYDEARYEDYIYTHTPHPALRGDDAEWARALIPAPDGR